MGQNLGSILADAGVKGGKSVKPKVTLADLQAIRTDRIETHSRKAMQNLPNEFSKLSAEKTGQEFLSTLKILLRDTPQEEVTDHLVIGIVQLAHVMRDDLSGSRRKSFKRIIPILLGVKKKILGNRRGCIKDIFLREIS